MFEWLKGKLSLKLSLISGHAYVLLFGKHIEEACQYLLLDFFFFKFQVSYCLSFCGAFHWNTNQKLFCLTFSSFARLGRCCHLLWVNDALIRIWTRTYVEKREAVNIGRESMQSCELIKDIWNVYNCRSIVSNGGRWEWSKQSRCHQWNVDKTRICLSNCSCHIDFLDIIPYRQFSTRPFSGYLIYSKSANL